MTFKPVIFLAFANEKVDNALFLRKLSLETSGIRHALSEAERSGLCELVIRTSATVADILDVFQDPLMGNRISIFHYGGHANGFSLLLESEDGKSNMATNKEGLVPYLARQENLKLVFLNGCSSKEQANDLLKAGISAVIGTTSEINDDTATQLATRFYSSLGDGSGIDKAWADATDEVKIKVSTENTRSLFWEGKQEISADRFPWVIQYKAGSDIIKDWNLPDISGNPLYGLPAIPQIYNLPESPFLYLNRYERRHAEIYFGRSYAIRALFASINDATAPPIILLYGQSGVGKSSLLEAGLQPRLEVSHEVFYLRRNAWVGLSATLYNALLKKCGFATKFNVFDHKPANNSSLLIEGLQSIAEKINDELKPDIHQLINKIQQSETSETIPATNEEQPPASTAEAWQYAEKKFNKPVLVILDQIEEAYTRPNEKIQNEMNLLFIDLKALFGNPSLAPKGKIILSFRKEYHPEIDEYCKNYELPRNKTFIDHINKKDIINVFNGFKETPRVKSRYNLSVEDGLPEIISADLSTDAEAPIAPMLQILLTKMWLKAIDANNGAPVFTHKLYYALKEEGLAMDEFLQNQLIELRKKLPDHFRTGFVLELLTFYCTPNSTSAARTEQQLLDNFVLAMPEASTIRQACTDLFLITELGGEEKSSMLAHDTLAKAVIKAQMNSTLPIQQAKRILISRTEAIRAGSNVSTLDPWELKLLDEIQAYLPPFTDEIKNLISISRKEIEKKERDKKLLNYAKTGIFLITIIGSFFIGYYYVQAKANAKKSYINHMAAASAMSLSRDPTLSLSQASEGIKIDGENSSAEIKRSFTHAYYNSIQFHNLWYEELFHSDLNYSNIIYNDQSKRMIPFMESDSLEIFDYNGHIVGGIAVVDDLAILASQSEFSFLQKIKWSHDGRTIIAMHSDGRIQFHQADGKLKKVIGAPDQYFSFDVSPAQNEVIALSGSMNNADSKYQIEFYNMDGTMISSISSDEFTNGISYSSDGNNIIITHKDYANFNISNVSDDPIISSRFELLNKNGKIMKQFDAKGEINYVINSPLGNFYCAALENSSLVLFNKEGKLINKIIPMAPLSLIGRESNEQPEIISLNFSPNDSFLLVCFHNKVAQMYNTYKTGQPINFKHNNLVTFAKFSDDGSRIMTGSSDNTAAIWDLTGKELFRLLGHQNDVTMGFFCNDDDKIITTSLDGTIKAWYFANKSNIELIGHKGPVNYIDLDSTNKYLVSAGYDHTLRLWDLNTQKEVDKVDLGIQGVRYTTFISKNEVLGIGNQNQAFLYTLFDHHLKYFIGHRDQIEWADAIGETIITASKDGSIRFWDKTSPNPKSKIINVKRGELLSLDISAVDSIVAVGTSTGDIFLYNNQGDSLKELSEHHDKVLYLDISNNGKYMVSASADGTAIIWDMLTKSQLARLERIACAPYNDCKVTSANFSYDGNHVITISSDRTIRLWDLSGKLMSSMSGHTDEITDAFFAPNDKSIYSYSADKTLRLWDLNGKEITSYPGHTDKINCATMENSLNKIYTASDDGTIRIWYTPEGLYKWLLKSNNTIHSNTKSQ